MLNRILNKKLFKNFIQIGLMVGLITLNMNVFAGDSNGTDMLAGTDADLISTVKGTGKTFLYIVEIIIACVGFIKTRNPTMFLGILALSVGFNVLLKIAGV